MDLQTFLTTIAVDVEGSSGGVAASGTITFVNYADGSISGANLTIDDVGLTEGSEWNAATSNAASATSVAAAINSSLSTVTASALGSVVTIRAVTPGSAGNSIVLDLGTIAVTGMTKSGATLSGGSN